MEPGRQVVHSSIYSLTVQYSSTVDPLTGVQVFTVQVYTYTVHRSLYSILCKGCIGWTVLSAQCTGIQSKIYTVL